MRWMSETLTNPIHADAGYVSRDKNDCPENRLQTSFAEAMMPQHSQCVQRLRTVANHAADVVRRRQRVGKRDGEHFRRCVTSDVGQWRRLDALLTSLLLSESYRLAYCNCTYSTTIY